MIEINVSWLLIFVYANICLLPLMFFAGILYERRGWNSLIQKGIIPRPSKQDMIKARLVEDDDAA